MTNYKLPGLLLLLIGITIQVTEGKLSYAFINVKVTTNIIIGSAPAISSPKIVNNTLTQYRCVVQDDLTLFIKWFLNNETEIPSLNFTSATEVTKISGGSLESVLTLTSDCSLYNSLLMCCTDTHICSEGVLHNSLNISCECCIEK